MNGKTPNNHRKETVYREKPHGGRLPGLVLNCLVYGLLAILAISIIYPLFWMFLSGFKTNSEIFADPWGFPSNPTFESYLNAWNQGIVSYLKNSVLVTATVVVITLFVASATSYALTKLRLPFAKTLTFGILGGLMVSPTSALVPLFRILQALNLYDTLYGLMILYIAYKLPFAVFLIRAYMLTLSDELTDAAVIDGANRFQIFWHIILPLCKPVLVSAGLVIALYAWNEFPFAMVFINSPDLKTLPVGLLSMKSAVQTDYSVLFAGLALAALPIMIAYVIGQKQFIRGLAEGSGK
jgi:raffinose/stachyose/melibiose transport system permease protein